MAWTEAQQRYAKSAKGKAARERYMKKRKAERAEKAKAKAEAKAEVKAETATK